MTVCKVTDCTNPMKAKGYCKKHYQRCVYFAKHRSRIFKNNKAWWNRNKAHVQAYCRARTRTPRGQWLTMNAEARKRKLEVTITFEDFCELRKRNACHYCSKKLPDAGSGMDRKDNAKGYIVGNVVPCCDLCNRTKNQYLSYEEMQVVMAFRAALEVNVASSR